MYKLLVFIILLTSCTNDLCKDITLNDYKFTEEIIVPIEDGKITVATIGNDTIFEGTISTTIEVPIYQSASFSFIDNENPSYLFYRKKMWGILLFEDTVNGDNDYNDLVMYVQYSINSYGPTVIEYIIPKAMGNSIPLKFGVNGFTLSSNVREDYFYNKSGFINTVYKENVPVKITTNWYTFQDNIRFYIISNGITYYTVDTKNGKLDGTPFGLFIPYEKEFAYPKETISIFDAYPKFKDWLINKKGDPFSSCNKDLVIN